MGFSWAKVIENSPVTQQAKVQAQIDATNAATKAIRDQITANEQAELAGQVAQTNAKANGYFQTRTLLSGAAALANDDAHDAVKQSNIDPFLSSGSDAQVRAKRRTTLLAG
jgi:hypothetical protein